jgi:hypothetical protein
VKKSRIQLRTGGLVAVMCLAGSLATASVAHAQEEDPGVSYKRKTVINFEDDTIEGNLKTPDGQYLEARKKMRHRSLIRIRRDFRRKIMSSIGEL